MTLLTRYHTPITRLILLFIIPRMTACLCLRIQTLENNYERILADLLTDTGTENKHSFLCNPAGII